MLTITIFTTSNSLGLASLVLAELCCKCQLSSIINQANSSNIYTNTGIAAGKLDIWITKAIDKK